MTSETSPSTPAAAKNGTDFAAEAQRPPPPDPALRKLDRFVGTWQMRGRTLDSAVDNIVGRTTFEFLPGGYFLLQRGTIDFGGFKLGNHELIGYDPQTDTFPSTVYPSMVGQALPYVWKVDGDELTIETEYIGATFRGRWSEDGTFSGGWRPNPGRENDPGNIPYDIWGSRAAAES
jgi:Protein of unknown function (DUF1579)